MQRGQQDRRGDHNDDADRGRYRQKSAGPRPVERAQLDGAGGAHLAPELPGDDEARDDEEHVRPDESTADAGHFRVKAKNGQQCEAAKPSMSGRKSFGVGRRLCTSSVGLPVSAWCKLTYLASWQGHGPRVEELSHTCSTVCKEWLRYLDTIACVDLFVRESGPVGAPAIVFLTAGI